MYPNWSNFRETLLIQTSILSHFTAGVMDNSV
jgi:hypothetical protein